MRPRFVRDRTSSWCMCKNSAASSRSRVFTARAPGSKCVVRGNSELSVGKTGEWTLPRDFSKPRTHWGTRAAGRVEGRSFVETRARCQHKSAPSNPAHLLAASRSRSREIAVLPEFSGNRQCEKDPPLTSSEVRDVRRGENLIPCRDLLVRPLRNESSTVKSTRGSDGPRSGCIAAHDCCNS
jgi:hypothetical protein